MRLTEDELIDIWRYFQYCCLPVISLARYAYFDYIEDIKREKKFYRHEVKHEINKIGKQLDRLPRILMDVGSQNVRYMNILSDNIDELLEDEKEELHRAIYISFRNAKWNHVDCMAALCYILKMLRIADVTFKQCCLDLKTTMGKDVTDLFHVYNLKEITDTWQDLVMMAAYSDIFDQRKKAENVDLENLRCTNAVNAIRKKLTSIDTLRIAIRKSYPWSPNYQEGVPYEESIDYKIVHSNQKQTE